VRVGWARLVVALDGTGFVAVDERGIVITLMTSKANQDTAEQIVIPRGDMPAACRTLEAWAALPGAATEAARVLPDRPAWSPQPETPHGPQRLRHRADAHAPATSAKATGGERVGRRG